MSPTNVLSPAVERPAPGPSPAEEDLGQLRTGLEDLGKQIGERFDRMSKLLGLVERVNTALFLEQALGYFYDSFSDVIPYDRIGCALLEAGGTVLRSVWARSTNDRVILPVGYTARLEGSSLKDVIDRGRPRIINDLEQYLRDHPQSDSTRRIVAEGLRSSLTCPLITMGRPIGVLFFSSTKPSTYADEHVAYFQQVAGLLSTVLEKTRLYEELIETQKRLETANARLARLADLDGLTEISNRRAFDRQLDLEWRRARRSMRPLSLLMLDVDYFKQYNDQYGHVAGDDCLKRVAGCLVSGITRAGDHVARFGGEEFAVLLPDTPMEGAEAVAQTLRRRVAALACPHRASPTGFVTVSVGGATLATADCGDAPSLLRGADASLYEAKRAGRDRVVVTHLS